MNQTYLKKKILIYLKRRTLTKECNLLQKKTLKQKNRLVIYPKSNMLQIVISRKFPSQKTFKFKKIK